MNAEFFFRVLLPPIMGAIIGLFTNWLAIVMLSRPYKEKRFLGVRLPFTPGILARERSRIAVSLGQVVSRELLTRETVASRLEDPALRVQTKDTIRGYVARLDLMRIGDAFESMSALGSGIVGEGLSKAFGTLAKSGAVRSGIRAALETALAELEDTSVGELLPAERFAALEKSLDEGPGSTKIMQRLCDVLASKFEAAVARGDSLSSIVPPETLGNAARLALEACYDPAISGIAAFLGKEELRTEIERIASDMVRKAFEKYNTIQRFFIGLGQFDKTLYDAMPGLVAELLADLEGSLRKPALKAMIMDALTAELVTASGKPLSQWTAFGEQEREKTMERIRRDLPAALCGIKLGRILRFARDELALGGRTVGVLLSEVSPRFRESVTQRGTDWIAGIISSQDAAGNPASRVADAFVRVILSNLADESVLRTLGLDGAYCERLSIAAADTVLKIAADESETLLAGLDIRKIVVDKIESLDIREVEKLIVDVVDKELRAITLLGGLLGGILGLFQSALALLFG